MKRSVGWALLGLTVLVLGGAGDSGAAVQGKDGVYWLGTGDWQLREEAGGVFLVKCALPRRDWLPKEERCKWHVSVPTITSPTGKFLASDPDGRIPSLHLVAEKGANTRWFFELGERLSPGRSTEESGRFKEGPSGCTFRARLAEGPFKGWYLAADERGTGPKDGKEPARRFLKLVRAARAATVFTYVETNYFVDHK